VRGDGLARPADRRRVVTRAFAGRAFWLMVADAGTKGAGALLALLLARLFGPADFGLYAAATAVAGLFVMLSYIGFEQEMVRRSAGAPLGESLALTLLSAGGMAVVAAGALVVQQSFFPNRLLPAGIIALAFLAQLAGRFHLSYRYAGIVLGETRPGAVIQSASTVALVLGTLGALMIRRTVGTALAVQLAVAVATIGAWEFWRRGRGVPYVRAAASTARRFFTRSMSFALTNVMWVLYFNVAVAMMAWMSAASDVGVYSAVYRLVAMTFVASSAVTSSFSPALFAAAKESAARHRALAAGMMRSVALVSIATALALGLLARPLILLIMGVAYLAGVPVARVLALAALFRGLNFGFSEMLTTAGRHPWRVGLEAGLLLANVALSVALIPAMGPMGGALAALGAEVVMTAGGLVLWRRLASISAVTVSAAAPATALSR
jgi:O-antigen/teichoic acid export membrane protein